MRRDEGGTLCRLFGAVAGEGRAPLFFVLCSVFFVGRKGSVLFILTLGVSQRGVFECGVGEGESTYGRRAHGYIGIYTVFAYAV